MTNEEIDNFDGLLEFDDPEETLYREVVGRRERYNSLTRLVLQLAYAISAMVTLWLLVSTRDWWYGIWALVFAFLSLMNAQVLNYKIKLGSLFRKENANDDGDI